MTVYAYGDHNRTCSLEEPGLECFPDRHHPACAIRRGVARVTKCDTGRMEYDAEVEIHWIDVERLRT